MILGPPRGLGGDGGRNLGAALSTAQDADEAADPDEAVKLRGGGEAYDAAKATNRDEAADAAKPEATNDETTDRLEDQKHRRREEAKQPTPPDPPRPKRVSRAYEYLHLR